VCGWYVSWPRFSLASDSADATRRVIGEVVDALAVCAPDPRRLVTRRCGRRSTNRESVVIAPWPGPIRGGQDAAAERAVAAIQDVGDRGERFRSDQGVKPAQRCRGWPVSRRGIAEIRWCCAGRARPRNFARTASLNLQRRDRRAGPVVGLGGQRSR